MTLRGNGAISPHYPVYRPVRWCTHLAGCPILINTGMRIDELLDTNIAYHDDLNQRIWDGHVLNAEVRETMLKIVLQFYMDLKVPEIEIDDIIFTGSLANYNWSRYSDIDLHIVVDMNQFGDNKEVFYDYFMTKKALWNKIHDITIKGFDVEMYVQDKNEVHNSSGVYSVSSDKWLVQPTNVSPEFDERTVKNKVVSIARTIDMVDPTCDNVQYIVRIKDKIKKMRQEGLDSGGEFSVGNLVFKVLRNNGFIEKLYDKYNAAIDSCYSL